MGKINCAFVASYYGPYYSNFTAAMLRFAKEMKQKGNNTVFVFPKETEKFEWINSFKKENITVYFIPYKPKSLNNLFALRKIFKNEKINLIYSHMCGWDFTAHFASPTTPIIWHMCMRVLVSDLSHKIKNWLKFKILANKKVHHIATSVSATKAINSLNPYNKCVHIPDSIDFTRLGDLSQNEVKKPYSLLIFGWAPIVKGLDITLDALEILNKDATEVKLLVSSQEKTEIYLNDRYEKLPCWIELLPPTDNIAEVYALADCMISASRMEGFSNALAEAIYSGLPIVYSDIPGTAWATEFKGTYQFESENVKSLISAFNKARIKGVSLEESLYNINKMNQLYSMDSWVLKVMDKINSIKIRG